VTQTWPARRDEIALQFGKTAGYFPLYKTRRFAGPRNTNLLKAYVSNF